MRGNTLAKEIRANDLARETEIAIFADVEIVRECDIHKEMKSNDELAFYINNNVTPVSVFFTN